MFLLHRAWCPSWRRRCACLAVAGLLWLVGVEVVGWYAEEPPNPGFTAAAALVAVVFGVVALVLLAWDRATGDRGRGRSEFARPSTERSRPHGVAPAPLPPVDDVPSQLLAGEVDGPILAGGYFRPRIDLPEAGGFVGIGAGAVVAAIATVVDWMSRIPAYRRDRGPVVRRLPRYTYVAVTPTTLVLAEFEQAPVRLKRVIGSWPRADLDAWRPRGESGWVDVRLADGRIATLEATAPGPTARAVIGLLVDGPDPGPDV